MPSVTPLMKTIRSRVRPALDSKRVLAYARWSRTEISMIRTTGQNLSEGR